MKCLRYQDTFFGRNAWPPLVAFAANVPSIRKSCGNCTIGHAESLNEGASGSGLGGVSETLEAYETQPGCADLLGCQSSTRLATHMSLLPKGTTAKGIEKSYHNNSAYIHLVSVLEIGLIQSIECRCTGSFRKLGNRTSRVREVAEIPAPTKIHGDRSARVYVRSTH